MNKDIFNEREILEMLNYVENVDEGDENVSLDDLKKKRLKKALMKKICVKNKKRNACKIAAACVCALTVIFTVPVFAKNIPSIKSIIQALNATSSNSQEYEKYSKMIDKSVTSNGLTLTINDIVCDEGNLMIGYKIKSKGDIKNIISRNPSDKIFKDFSLISFLRVNSNIVNSSSGGPGKFLDNHTYINSESFEISNKNLPNVFKVDLDINEIYGVKGKWKFRFTSSKEDMLKNTKKFYPNTVAKIPSGLITVKKVTFTPISTFIQANVKYNEKNINDIKNNNNGFMPQDDFFVFDDKGNEIEENGNSSTISADYKQYYYRYDFANLKYIPKYLTVVPYSTHYNEEGSQRILKDINGIYPIELSQGKMGKIIINKITTENDKTIVNYSVKGLAPIFQSRWMYIVDDKDNVVDSLGESKKIEGKPNNYIMEFKALDKNKKYKIGTSNCSDIEVREDLKFKIDLKK